MVREFESMDVCVLVIEVWIVMLSGYGGRRRSVHGQAGELTMVSIPMLQAVRVGVCRCCEERWRVGA